ncbi:MAG: helix-turn-helix domain containing protein [Proteobacteria bacterium]|nr:helix-turn-helix domain containing protein [Pseudomonadota bacterium]
MARKPDTASRALNAAVELAATTGWQAMSLADVARAAGITLGQLHEAYGSKNALLDGLSARIDAVVLADSAGETGDEAPRDRLFDVMMRRLEAQAPHRDALRSIARAAGSDPLAAVAGLCRLQRSMRWMLEAAGIDSSGPAGRMRSRALALIYLDVMRVWFADDSADLGRTMVALDRRLAQADRAVTRLAGLGRPGRRGDAAEQAAV